MVAALCFWHVMHNLTTLRMADLPLGIQNFSLKCARMWFCPACNNSRWKLAISSWATWCFGGTIIGNLASNAIGASVMRPPTLMTQSSNMGWSFTILLERLTWPLVSKSCISSAYSSLCTSLTIVNVAFSRSAVVRCFSISAFLSLILKVHLEFQQPGYLSLGHCPRGILYKQLMQFLW